MLLFAYPALELIALYHAAQALGWWLLAWQLASAGLGYLLLTEQPLHLASQLFTASRRGETPWPALLSVARNSVAALLFILPGVLNDALAFLILLWPAPARAAHTAPPPGQRDADGVIEGEFQRVDPDAPPHDRLR